MAYSGPTRIQSAVGTTPGSAQTSVDVVLSSAVTAGSTLVVVVCDSTSIARTYTVTDSQGNTWSKTHGGSTLRQVQNGRSVAVHCAVGVAAGATTVTCTCDGASSQFAVQVYELSACEIDTWSSFGNSSSTTTFHLAAVSEINTVANVYVTGGAAFNASPTSIVAPTGFTLRNSGTSSPFYATIDEETEAAETAERATLTLTTARLGPGILVSWKNVAAGGGPFPHFTRRVFNGGMV